jgi:AraC family transcriptional activator of mar-sox-rob regulon
MNTGAFIHDLLGWIDNNLDSRLDIDTVSRRAGYSKWHLQRIFKEHTGYPLAEYIRAQKLQKSVERLAHSDEPILNVAIALGFDSQQSFNRSFKRQFGQAPGAWRRSMRANAGVTPAISALIGKRFTLAALTPLQSLPRTFWLAAYCQLCLTPYQRWASLGSAALRPAK